MFGRLPLKLAAAIVFLFSFLLFLSGWFLQQQSLNALQAALNSPGAKPTLSSRKHAYSKAGYKILGQSAPSYSPISTAPQKKVAYVQYAASKDEVCSIIMLFADLHRLQSVAEKVLLYPRTWDEGGAGTWKRLLKSAEYHYGVLVKAVDPWLEDEDRSPAATLLHVWAESKYSRVIHVSSTGMILRNLDNLFSLPSTPLAAARSYHPSSKKGSTLSPHLLVIEPTPDSFNLLRLALMSTPSAASSELINSIFSSHSLVLPQYPHVLLTSEFRNEDHASFLMSAEWDPKKIFGESYYVHFSDEELPKPWYILPWEMVERVKPRKSEDENIWKEIYDMWGRKRMDTCGLDLEPLP